MSCKFCRVSDDSTTGSSQMSRAFYDQFPISKGHTLIIPRRHVASFFGLTPEEQADLFALASKCKETLDAEFSPSGYNLGINDGQSAGQTIMHVHLHLIPRYEGDKEDPRGGIRWIFPDKAAYWDDSEHAHE